MASNFVLTINSVDSESINFSISFVSEAKENYTSGQVNVSNDYRMIEEYSLSVTLSNHSSQTYTVTNGGSYTYNYTRPDTNLGNLLWNLNSILTVTQKKYTGQWGTSSTQTFGPYTSYQVPNINTTPTYKPNSTYPSSREVAQLQILGQTPDSAGNPMIIYQVVVTTQYAVEVANPAISYQYLKDTKDIYPRPANFTFNNCESGKQWKVDEGINSLITNIQDFYLYATQWKSWKQQSAANQCSQFDSPISAARMNEISNYVGASGSYSQGDKVSAAMFNNLASAINNG